MPVQLADQPGDKYDDIWGPNGESPGGGGGGQPYGGGGSGIPNPFIPGFAGGQAQGFGGFGAETPWGGFGQRRRLMGTRSPFGMQQSRMEGGGQAMGSGVGPQGGAMPSSSSAYINKLIEGLRNSQGNPMFGPGGGGGGGQINSLWDRVQDIIGGGAGSQSMTGGAFGYNPPSAIMAGIRGQAVQDAGARERSARLGLQSRGDTDPSTYGFQALMSQLGGQDQTARTMSQADLGMRQQQLAFLQNLLGQALGANVSLEGQNRQSRAAWESGGGRSGLGQAAGMAGGLAGFLGGGGGGGGGYGGGSQMGQPGFQYPYYGG